MVATNYISSLVEYNFDNRAESCCASAQTKDLCRQIPTLANGVYVEGCFTKVKEEIMTHINTVGGVSIAVIVVMVC